MVYGGMGGGIVGGSATAAGATAIAVLPQTGGSRGVVAVVALTSIAIGAVVLVSTAVRFVAKRHFSA